MGNEQATVVAKQELADRNTMLCCCNELENTLCSRVLVEVSRLTVLPKARGKPVAIIKTLMRVWVGGEFQLFWKLVKTVWSH